MFELKIVPIDKFVSRDNGEEAKPKPQQNKNLNMSSLAKVRYV